MRGRLAIAALASLALSWSSVLASASAAPAPPGELWFVTTASVCRGVDRTLHDYETAMRKQIIAVSAQLGHPMRTFTGRSELLAALAGHELHGWLFLLFSGHGKSDAGGSHVCIGADGAPGEWLDLNRELLPALPVALSGAVLVLDSCDSADVDPRLAKVPTAIVSASPYTVNTGALFGETALATLAAARDDNCNGVFDDDDLFAGLNHRLQASLSLVAFQAWPKLRRNAASPLPIPVTPQSAGPCAGLAQTAGAIPPSAFSAAFVAAQRRQTGLATGADRLPVLDHDLFVVAPGATPAERDAVRTAAGAGGLEEITGLDRPQAAALAQITGFAEIYWLEPAQGWLRTWRLRDGLLVADVRISDVRCGIPARTVASDPAPSIPDQPPRYLHAVRYLRDVPGTPPGPATACFEPEGQCFVAPAPPAGRCPP